MKTSTFFFTILLAALSSAALAQAGELDNTFGNNGIVTTDIGSNYDFAWSSAAQSNGKIVLAGYVFNVISNYDFALVRYNTDGTLDASFGNSGIVITDFTWGWDWAYSMAIQSDGKIVAAGRAFDGSHNCLALARYNSNGTLDNTFGTAGKVTSYVNSSSARFRSVAIQPDGKIVAAGYASNDFLVARYNSNGILDNTFGSGGITTTDFFSDLDMALSMALQSDGKIVVSGTSYIGTSSGLDLARYNSDGTLDNSFGNYGKVTTHFGIGDNWAYSVMIQSDGKIVLSGGVLNGTGYDVAVDRFNSDGSNDNSFGTNGEVITDIDGYDDFAHSLSVQPDGKILAAGGAQNGSDYDFTLLRYNSDGTLDNSFDTDGKVTTAFYSGNDRGYEMNLLPDGKIFVAGTGESETGSDFAVAKYNSDGTLDNSFSGDGKANTGFGASDDFAGSVALQQDGKILVAGSSTGGFTLVRYNSVGTLDNSFSEDGKIIGSGGFIVALEPDGGVVIAGNVFSSSASLSDFTLTRLNIDGTVDISFGVNGTATAVLDSTDDYPQSEAAQSDGKIVVVGESWDYYGNYSNVAVVRFNTDGSLDNSFGTNGSVITDLGSDYDVVPSVAIQSDGKIVAAGSNGNFVLTRYNTDGTLDVGFGTNGIATEDFNFSGGQANAVAIQPDGKIIAAGISNNQFALVRFNGNGTLDNSFGTEGKVTTAIGDGGGAVSIAIQTDGKIVAAGNSYSNQDGYYEFALARYNENGTLDLSFGSSGIAITLLGPNLAQLNAMSLQPDGKIITAGFAFNGTDNDFLLTRYLSGLEIGIADFSSPQVSPLIYPNPIQQTEVFKYTLTKDEVLTLSLYDVNGRVAQTFFTNEPRIAGEHMEELNFENLAAGNYLLTLSNGSQQVSVKIVKQ